ncbi:MAG: alpha/beta hydrolase, partial [Alcaligenaceae bacterium]|nr:alpha/beta hydrolase [Alcaligenaceae bacterium]
LIHGSLCDHRYWRWQMPEFASHFRVVAPSLPGCWPEAVGSGFPPETDHEVIRQAALADTRYSIERHVRAIVDLCRQADTATAIHLVGHSRGAQVALEAALAMPGRIKRLVLADPGFPFTDEPATQPIHAPIARKLGHAPLDEVIGEFVDAVNGADTWRRTVSWFKDIVRANAWTLLPQLNDIHRSIDRSALAEALTCPVLLVGGEYSPRRYGSRIEGLMEALPQARHRVVPRAAHGMNLANARYFNDAVLAFLRDEEPSG